MTVTPAPGTASPGTASPGTANPGTANPGTGYDPGFLGVPMPLPTRPDRPDEVVRLDYVHFSVVQDTTRRLAALTAVNIDGSALIDVDRGDDWHLDPRLDPTDQAGPALYATNDLDRGHLVRRRDPVWGTRTVAEQANFDTFVYTNAAPQAARFNQSLQLWLGLEDHVLTYAQTTDQHLSVFTGPVLAPEDPTYRGIQLPRRFYKIAAWTTNPTPDAPHHLSATAYVLDQTPQLDDIDLTTQRTPRQGQPPPLGPFRTYQVPLSAITDLTGLHLGPLLNADRLPAVPRTLTDNTDGTATASQWTVLRTTADIQL